MGPAPVRVLGEAPARRARCLCGEPWGTHSRHLDPAVRWSLGERVSVALWEMQSLSPTQDLLNRGLHCDTTIQIHTEVQEPRSQDEMHT